MPKHLLVTMDPGQLNHWLSETRKVSSEPYHPTTIHNILSSDIMRSPINFFKKGFHIPNFPKHNGLCLQRTTLTARR